MMRPDSCVYQCDLCCRVYTTVPGKASLRCPFDVDAGKDLSPLDSGAARPNDLCGRCYQNFVKRRPEVSSLPDLANRLSAERGDTSVFVIEIRNTGTMIDVQMGATLNDREMSRLRMITIALGSALDHYARALAQEELKG